MSKSYTALLYHLVFSTRDRRPWLVDAIRPRVHEYLGGVVRGEGGIALCVGGTADHVHILARLRQDQAVSEVVRVVKANSSGWLHRSFPLQADFAWQGGYGAFTVGRTEVEAVRRYVEGQEEHHRMVAFQDEFVTLLKRYEVEYDERYLWA